MKEMIQTLRYVFGDGGGSSRTKVIGLYVLLIVFNVGVWTWAVIAFAGNTVLLGAGVLAYTFGLRHAFDADHIASIDSVTRKLMQRNTRPTTVGFYFAVGHSLALLAFVAVIAGLGAWGPGHRALDLINGSAGVASTIVSATFLLVMAALNLTIARSTYRIFRRVRSGGAYIEENLDTLLDKRGFFARIFRPLFRLVERSWHMMFIGLLFGLGFDTATEVSLLGIAGAEAARGLSVWLILIFPTLFAAGMTLMDTTDSVVMVRAYGWAFREPVRKLRYNLTITIVSALVALTVAGIEALALVSEQLQLNGGIWKWVNYLSDHWGSMGVFVVLLFVGSLLISMLFYHRRRDGIAAMAIVPARSSILE